VLNELAFALMDTAANAAFNRDLPGAGDERLDGLALLPLFLSMRAAIRAHVVFMKSEHAGESDAVWQEAAAGGDRRIVGDGQIGARTRARRPD